jgi:hypothetical protein
MPDLIRYPVRDKRQPESCQTEKGDRQTMLPKVKAPPLTVDTDQSDFQVPSCEDYLYCDPDYLVDAYAKG